MSRSNLDAALEYARLGLHVFPCEPRGKRPLGRLAPNGLKAATTDESTIRAWWTDTPDANIGIATGPEVFVIDLDGPEGEDTYGRLLAEHGALTEHPTKRDGASVATPGAGWHLYVRLPAGINLGNTARRLGPGVDTRGAGGYVLAPPSVHPSGGRYVEIDELQAPLPEARPWLVGLLRRPERPRLDVVPAPPSDQATRYGREAARGELAALEATPEGARNHRLNSAAFALGQLVAGGELPAVPTRDMLIAAGRAIGLGRQEVERTVDSGLRAGMDEPRRAPERNDRRVA